MSSGAFGTKSQTLLFAMQLSLSKGMQGAARCFIPAPKGELKRTRRTADLADSAVCRQSNNVYKPETLTTYLPTYSRVHHVTCKLGFDYRLMTPAMPRQGESSPHISRFDQTFDDAMLDVDKLRRWRWT
jgi:hypothetical protein